MAKKPPKEGAGASKGPDKAARSIEAAGAAGAGGNEPPSSTPYVVLARKYRPQTFADLIGQDAMVRTLRNAFATGRIAQAYMLTGVRGVGKTTTARILARGLNYVAPDAPNDIEDRNPGGPTVDMPAMGRHCLEIIESRHPDVVEMDAASNTGVDNVREIIESARYRPVSARIKVFIIDEVHMLSKGAFNALLKTLEEPPAHVKFIFATTEIRKVPVTVLSRCQRFDLRRVAPETLAEHYARIVAAEGGTAEPDALALIARAAGGSVRDGLSILDQALAIGAGKVSTPTVREMLGLADRSRVFTLFETTLSGDAAGALAAFDGLYRDGAEPTQLLADLADVAHLVSRAKVAGAAGAGDMLSQTERDAAAGLADRLSVPLITRAWQSLVQGLEDAGRAPDPRAAVDMILIRLAHMAELPGPEHLARLLDPARASAAPREADTARSPAAAPSASLPSSAETTAAAPRHQDADAMPATHHASFDEPMPQAEPPGFRAPAEPGDAPTLRTWLDVIALADRHRDINFKIELEERVRPISIEPGRLEIAVEAGAPPNLAGLLTEKLGRWTGDRWVVIVATSSDGAAPTFAEERKAREDRELAEIEADPIVRDMRKHFPDAEIKSWRPIEGDSSAADTAAIEPEADDGPRAPASEEKSQAG